MEESLENKINLKNKLIKFYNIQKVKIYSLIFILIICLISYAFLKYKNEKKNILISEKYIKAGFYLASDKKDSAKDLYEEIILSGNRFYSILALNTIIEKELVLDKNKILKYFEILKRSVTAKNRQDLLTFKKALYLIKISDTKDGNELLNNLISSESILKPAAEELLKK